MITTYFLIVFFLFAGCHKDIADYSQASYFPNKVGDSWEYIVTDSAQSSPSNPSSVNQYTVTVKITGLAKLLDGKDAAIWQYQYPWGNDTNYVRITGDTVTVFDLVYSRTIDDLTYPRIIFLIPFNAKQRWKGLLLNLDTSVVLNESDFTGRTQTFSNCFNIYHHYVGYNTEFNDYYWFKPSVGMVAIQTDHYNNGPDLYRSWVLKEYDVN